MWMTKELESFFLVLFLFSYFFSAKRWLKWKVWLVPDFICSRLHVSHFKLTSGRLDKLWSPCSRNLLTTLMRHGKCQNLYADRLFAKKFCGKKCINCDKTKFWRKRCINCDRFWRKNYGNRNKIQILKKKVRKLRKILRKKKSVNCNKFCGTQKNFVQIFSVITATISMSDLNLWELW